MGESGRWQRPPAHTQRRQTRRQTHAHPRHTTYLRGDKLGRETGLFEGPLVVGHKGAESGHNFVPRDQFGIRVKAIAVAVAIAIAIAIAVAVAAIVALTEEVRHQLVDVVLGLHAKGAQDRVDLVAIAGVARQRVQHATHLFPVDGCAV